MKSDKDQLIEGILEEAETAVAYYDELKILIKQAKFAHKDLLHDIPDDFIEEFKHLFKANVLPTKSVAEFIKLKYDVIRILDQII